MEGIRTESLMARLGADKKTLHGKVHFVLPVRIGEVKITSDIDPALVRKATSAALEAQ